MSTVNAHVARADRYIVQAESVSIEDGHAQLNATLAVAEATLALVEAQQAHTVAMVAASGRQA